MRSADRLIVLAQVENDIMRARPEFDEAIDIVIALEVSLKSRYPAEQMWDCEHYFQYLRQALERAPMLTNDPDECGLARELDI